MKIIKVRCPCCNEEICVNIDLSQYNSDKELSEVELQNVLKENKIEFG